MKTQLKKIVIGAAALAFLMTGVSFAHDGGKRHHKPHNNVYKYHKAKKVHSHRHKKHFKPRRHYRNRHTGYDVRHHHYYKKHHRHWKKRHIKHRRPYRDRYRSREIHHHSRDHGRRRASSEDLIYKVALKDPGIVFKVILKDR